jgi:hypothetical protein
MSTNLPFVPHSIPFFQYLYAGKCFFCNLNERYTQRWRIGQTVLAHEVLEAEVHISCIVYVKEIANLLERLAHQFHLSRLNPKTSRRIDRRPKVKQPRSKLGQ